MVEAANECLDLRVSGFASRSREDVERYRAEILAAVPVPVGFPWHPERVAQLAPNGVDAAIDVSRRRIGTRPDGEPETPNGVVSLAAAAALHAEAEFVITIERVFALKQSAEAHRVSQGGHVRGQAPALTVP